MIGNNLLVFKIQPEEGVYLEFNAKKPGQENLIIPVKMDFCQNCDIGINTPEAYERLIFDILKGNKASLPAGMKCELLGILLIIYLIIGKMIFTFINHKQMDQKLRSSVERKNKMRIYDIS